MNRGEQGRHQNMVVLQLVLLDSERNNLRWKGEGRDPEAI
jgi:hypothetical protein